MSTLTCPQQAISVVKLCLHSTRLLDLAKTANPTFMKSLFFLIFLLSSKTVVLAVAKTFRKNLQKIRKLVTAYYTLPPGALIRNPDELIPLFKVKGAKDRTHPHEKAIVYISRRALKHFVERRTEELHKNHTPEKALQKIFFIIDSFWNTICEFDDCWNEPYNRVFYNKAYPLSSKRNRVIRVLVEIKSHGLEIVSMHLRKK